MNGKYGLLYDFRIVALKKFQSDWLVAENVRGFLSANNGEAKRKTLRGFQDTSYKIFPHLYKFEEYGIPQTRHRIIVVDIRNDLEKIFRPPMPFNKVISARVALENPTIADDAANHELTKQSREVVERLKYIIDWYGYIAGVSNELQNEISLMDKFGKTPKDFGLKVRRHPDTLTITAPNKMRVGTKIQWLVELSKILIETPRLINNKKVLDDNKNLIRDFIDGLEKFTRLEDLHFKNLWRGVSKNLVANLIFTFKTNAGKNINRNQSANTLWTKWTTRFGTW